MWLRLLLSFVLPVSFASRYRLSVAFGSKVVDRTLDSNTKYTNHTKPGSPATTGDYPVPILFILSVPLIFFGQDSQDPQD